MKFSIVTPSYNKGAYLERTIRSVLVQRQKGVDLEYFILDNFSTDQTAEILSRYQAQALDDVTIVQQPDRGQADAINYGWAKATGDILAWLNADDVYLEGALAQVESFFQSHPEVMAVYGEAVYLDDRDRVIKSVTNIRDYSRPNLLSHDFITQPATFIRRQVFEQVGELSTEFRYVFDWEYWIRVSQHYAFVRVPFAIAGYRITGDNLTLTGNRRRLREMVQVVWRYGGIPHLVRFFARLAKKYLFGQPEIPPVQQ